MSSHDMHAPMANAVRSLAMDAVEAAKSGHPGLPMGAADVATVLFGRFLRFDPADPSWPDRDRFVLSAGHGSMLLYALLYLTGTRGMTLDEIKRFRQLGSKTPGHPEFGHTEGVETTTGPLGQGLATAVGMALAERVLAAEFGPELVDHRTYVLASDGDLMEGVSQEAIALAGHLRLSRLIVLWDDNGISIDGPLALSDSVDQVKRFEAAGWRGERVDGHDPEAIAAALTRAQSADRPTLIACRTVIGFGAPRRAGTSKAHGEPLGPEEVAGAKAALHLAPEPFAVAADALAQWRRAGERGQLAHRAWKERCAAMDAHRRAAFDRRLAGTLPSELDECLAALAAQLAAAPQTIATRKASELVLEAISPVIPELVVGSADLSPSNNTKVKALAVIEPGTLAGRYLHYGVREHAMAAAMNGMSLHGGLRPVGATFLVFSDYCRPAMRLAALMNRPIIYVMTHDSIGLGEDGPTHQPVEHFAALRAMPNLNLFRPADPVETAECWQLALASKGTPSVLALSRQALTAFRTAPSPGNRCAAGAYECAPAMGGAAQVSLFASGSEVETAMEARALLAARGIRARVVSVPCMELFAAQPAWLREEVIGSAPVRVGIEAGIRMGWDPIIGSDGEFVGMSGFGASAPAKALFEHFGITGAVVADRAAARLKA